MSKRDFIGSIERAADKNTPPTFPLLTLLVVSGVGLVFLAAQRDTSMLSLLYSRAALADGELWRLLTGHLMHFSWTHLAADIGGFLLLGVLIEREQGRATFASLLLVLALGTSAGLWLFVPELGFYGGISALNYGLLTWFCLTQRTVVQERWQWIPALFPVLIMAHIGWQYTTEQSLISAGLPRSVRVAWQAHLAAVLLAFACCGVRDCVRTWRERQPSSAAAQ
jgi:rhomboid family GlyGly-CTERM serine protease